MNKQPWKTLAFAGVGLLSIAAFAFAEENKDKPKVSAADFKAGIARDTSEMRSTGPVVTSYADVVEKILPSVVSVGSFSKKLAEA